MTAVYFVPGNVYAAFSSSETKNNPRNRSKLSVKRQLKGDLTLNVRSNRKATEQRITAVVSFLDLGQVVGVKSSISSKALLTVLFHLKCSSSEPLT